MAGTQSAKLLLSVETDNPKIRANQRHANEKAHLDASRRSSSKKLFPIISWLKLATHQNNGIDADMLVCMPQRACLTGTPPHLFPFFLNRLQDVRLWIICPRHLSDLGPPGGGAAAQSPRGARNTTRCPPSRHAWVYQRPCFGPAAAGKA